MYPIAFLPSKFAKVVKRLVLSSSLILVGDGIHKLLEKKLTRRRFIIQGALKEKLSHSVRRNIGLRAMEKLVNSAKLIG
jgi:hypothetical protein